MNIWAKSDRRMNARVRSNSRRGLISSSQKFGTSRKLVAADFRTARAALRRKGYRVVGATGTKGAGASIARIRGQAHEVKIGLKRSGAWHTASVRRLMTSKVIRPGIRTAKQQAASRRNGAKGGGRRRKR